MRGSNPFILTVLAGGLLAIAGCGRGPVTLGAWPLDSPEEIIDRGAEGIRADPDGIAEGRVALEVEAAQPRTVRLVELRPARGLGGRLIVVTAKMKCAAVRGFTYPELWVHSADGRDLQVRENTVRLLQSRRWTDMRLVYRCEPGERPDRLRVNLVIEGLGRAWIHDLKVTSEPLPKAGGGAR